MRNVVISVSAGLAFCLASFGLGLAIEEPLPVYVISEEDDYSVDCSDTGHVVDYVERDAATGLLYLYCK